MSKPHFDTIAPSYDDVFTDTSIGRWQRRIVWDALADSVVAGERVLEVGCGTGEDATFLASLGCSVLATDASPEMVEVARRRTQEDAQSRTTHVAYSQNSEIPPPGVAVAVADLPLLEQLSTGTRSAPGHHAEHTSFDVVFSNFGALNCLSPEDIQEFFEHIATRLRAGGRLILVVMPEFCLLETIYFLITGRWRLAFRRRTSPQLGSASAAGPKNIPVWYHSVSTMHRLANAFDVVGVTPVGLFVPPSFLQPWFSSRPFDWLGTQAAKADRLVARRARSTSTAFGQRRARWVAGLSDHYLIELRLRRSDSIRAARTG